MRRSRKSATTTTIFKKAVRNPAMNLFFVLFFVVGRLMPRGMLISTGKQLGKLSYTLFPSEKRKTIIHLSQAFPDKSPEEISRISRDVFINIGMNFAELIWLPRMRPKHIDRIVEFENIKILERLKKSGKPVLIITGHIGNWELLAAAAAHKGYPSTVIARRQNNSWLNNKIIKLRSKWKVETILRDEPGSSRRILSILKSGGFLATLMDQDTKIESVFVDFFGRKAYTPSGPAAISLRSGCEVVIAYIHRNSLLKHIVKFKYVEPITPTGFRDIDIVNRTHQFTSLLEEAIKEHPEQWVWMHKRWKTQQIEANKIRR
jgi:KDO2-lipid IV(A) lauroyltransferase